MKSLLTSYASARTLRRKPRGRATSSDIAAVSVTGSRLMTARSLTSRNELGTDTPTSSISSGTLDSTTYTVLTNYISLSHQALSLTQSTWSRDKSCTKITPQSKVWWQLHIIKQTTDNCWCTLIGMAPKASEYASCNMQYFDANRLKAYILYRNFIFHFLANPYQALCLLACSSPSSSTMTFVLLGVLLMWMWGMTL